VGADIIASIISLLGRVTVSLRRSTIMGCLN
jgi:hypothetical protein